MLIIVRNTDEVLSRMPFADTDTWLCAGVHRATDWRYAVMFDRVTAATIRAGMHSGARILSTEDFAHATDGYREGDEGGVGGDVPLRGLGAAATATSDSLRSRPDGRLPPERPAGARPRSGGDAGHSAARLGAPASRPQLVAARSDWGRRGVESRMSAADEWERFAK